MSAHLDNEETLVLDAQAGSREAFATLLNQYARRLYRLALNITGNQDDAADALQEAFLKAYRSLRAFRRDSRFYTWLFQIVLNESRSLLRKRRRTDLWVSLDEPTETDDFSNLMPREIEDWGDNPEQKYSKTELHEILERNMERLEPTLRLVFLLRDVEELSIAETAAMLDLSVPAVKSRLLRARLKLRQLLTQSFRQG
ncbi:MAG TPA: sigma-70 family RNA polymerase sigma factor [Candidatus Acidoferrum sp.]|nr:sigma-70 family RNA polymerase sigma factor [Candidatus Acidoferrum sp.]